MPRLFPIDPSQRKNPTPRLRDGIWLWVIWLQRGLIRLLGGMPGRTRCRSIFRRAVLLASRYFHQPLSVEELRLIGQANAFITFAFGHDSVIEADVGGSLSQLAHLEGRGSLLRDIQTLAVAVRRQIHVVVHAGVNGLGKNAFQVDTRRAVGERAGTE